MTTRVAVALVCEKPTYSYRYAEWLARRQRRKTDEPITAYPCRPCRGWHVGHSDKKFY